MILSVIIVNYNVKHFLEQCLYSVERSLLQLGQMAGSGASGIEPAGSEIIVIDNHSSDGSLAYLRPRFPRVVFIANEDNRGFGAANNQALLLATGRYILFLNPDTILPEDCCATCIAFLRSTPDAGAAGVRMIDGKGRFLKESRRGFPTPWVAFSKLSGLAALFPRSRFFAGYYLGHLPATANHPAPILSGACLWVSREALDKTGGFDELFFMYAEDIDLSWRIEQQGFTNYYIADTTIIHFKGESTSKDIRYTRMFYKAMSQFRRKHAKGKMPSLLNGFVETGIWLRAAGTAIGNLFRTGAGSLINALTQKDSHAKTRTTATWLTGDPTSIQRLKPLISAIPGMHLVAGLPQADEIILCQGTAYSFRKCIDTLREGPERMSWKIHAAGSDSMAGGHSQVDLPIVE